APGGSAHLIVDVTGCITSASAPVSASGRFVPTVPNRRYDSRNLGGLLLDDQVVDVVSGSPAGASGVVLNLTVTGTARYGFVTAWAPGAPEPATSALNFATGGVTIANAAGVRPDGAGAVRLRVTDQSRLTSGPLTHLIVDVFGWFT
nr:hypothetical protein [Ilumatobacteraceae bacterium]